MEDLDALLAELEQSSCLASKERALQGPSSCQNAQQGTPKVPLPPRAQPPGEGLDSVYSVPVRVPKPLLPSAPRTEAASQLDELLADLGHTQSKLAAAGQGAEVPAESVLDNVLDNMLDSLTRDLQELGITAAPAGVCAACRKPIAGKVLTALGRTWHPEHFTCAQCGRELDKGPFFRQPPPPPPAPSPRLFLQKVLTALEQTWHPEHFFCAHCGKVFGDEGFLERNGKPYCHQDFLAMFAPKCQGCERPVMGNYLSALQGVWHSECFVCTECLTGFSGGSFFELEGRPYCELHFHQRQGTICHGCGRPVSGRCVTAAGRRYHPEHFVCSYCMRRLHKGTFSECGDKMYCQPCYDKLFLSAPVPQHSVPAWMAPASPCLVLSLLTHTRLIPHPSTSLVLIPLSQLSPALLLPSPASFLVPLPARHPWHCPLDLKQ
ncbi:PREDICTED: leupaxin [Ficedula albicollis]|uniref:leupaxin n=1 Tax=Ficedula albicollis TaxID=59894 RepID=UPI0007AD7CF5|nr:PREDICTED: leupaxin [Ficedula albicollis]